MDQDRLEALQRDGEDTSGYPWLLSPIVEGTSVIVNGRSENGDSSFSGQTGIIECHCFVEGIGNTYCVIFGEGEQAVKEGNISPGMVQVAP